MTCQCVGKHVPLPVTLFEIGGSLVCATTFFNVKSFIQECEKHKGRPPGYVRKHYSEYAQRLAKQEIDILGLLDTRSW